MQILNKNGSPYSICDHMCVAFSWCGNLLISLDLSGLFEFRFSLHKERKELKKWKKKTELKKVAYGGWQQFPALF